MWLVFLYFDEQLFSTSYYFSYESPSSSVYCTENGNCIGNFQDSAANIHYFHSGLDFNLQAIVNTRPGISIHSRGSFQEGMRARSPHAGWCISLLGHILLLKNIWENKCFPKTKTWLRIFYHPGLNSSFLCYRVSSAGVGRGHTGHWAGTRWVLLILWSLFCTAIILKWYYFRVWEKKRDNAALLNCREGRKFPFILCCVL